MHFLPPLATLFATSTLAANVRTVYQFPKPTWLENIAATRNNSLLVSVIGRAEVHIVDPQVEPAAASLLASFPNANAVLGITELDDNIFAVGVGNTTPANTPVLGTFGVWSIDLRKKHAEGGTARVTKIASAPDVQLVNGMATLNTHTLLLADSWAGNIVAFNTKTGAYGVALEHETLKSNFSAALPIGVNGLKIYKEKGSDDVWLYYTNTVQSLLGRVRIDASTGHAIGPFTILASGSNISVPDDFAVANDGSVYLAGPLTAPQGDTVQHVCLDGRVETVAQGGVVSGATAAALGKTRGAKGVVYVSTMGGFGEDGAPKAGGRVVAVSVEEKEGRKGREF